MSHDITPDVTSDLQTTGSLIKQRDNLLMSAVGIEDVSVLKPRDRHEEGQTLVDLSLSKAPIGRTNDIFQEREASGTRNDEHCHVLSGLAKEMEGQITQSEQRTGSEQRPEGWTGQEQAKVSGIYNASLEETLESLKSQLMKSDLLVTKSQSLDGRRRSTDDSGTTEADGMKAAFTEEAERPAPNDTNRIQTSGPSNDPTTACPQETDNVRPGDHAPGSTVGKPTEYDDSTVGVRETKPPPIPARRRPEPIAKRFNISGLLDVNIRSADPSTVNAEAMVTFDYSNRRGAAHSITIAEVNQTNNGSFNYKYILSAAPAEVQLPADPELYINELVSMYHMIWNQAAEKRISSIALSPILDNSVWLMPNAGKLAASAICRSLLNLATNRSLSCIKEVTVACTGSDVLLKIVQMFEEGVNSKGNVIITRNKGHSEWPDVGAATVREDTRPHDAHVYNNVMGCHVDRMAECSSARSDPEADPTKACQPMSVLPHHDETPPCDTVNDNKIVLEEPVYTNTDSAIQRPSRATVPTDEEKSEAAHSAGIIYKNVDLAGLAPASSNRNVQVDLATVEDFSKISEQVSTDDESDGWLSDEFLNENENVSFTETTTSDRQGPSVQSEYTNVEYSAETPHHVAIYTNNTEGSSGTTCDEVNVKRNDVRGQAEEEAYVPLDADLGRKKEVLQSSAIADAVPYKGTLYEDVYVKEAGNREDDLIEPEYTSASASSQSEIYDSIDDSKAASPARVIRTKASRMSIQRQQQIDLPVGFLVDGSLRLLIYEHDLTERKVDVIVNPTNGLLQATGSVSRSIREAAGPSLATDLGSIVANGGPLKVGDVVETLAGQLPCKHVLHAAVPPWPDLHDNCKQQYEYLYDLRATIVHVLQYANNISARSIALSNFVSDTDLLQVDLFTKSLFSSIVAEAEAIKRKSGAFLDEIHVVSKSPEVLTSLAAHCLDAQSRAGIVTMLPKPDLDSALWASGAADRGPPVGVSERSGASRRSSFEPRAFKVGDQMTVVVHVSDIVRLRVDAIVSVDSCHLDHADGVAKVICEAAGSQMAAFLAEIILYRSLVAVSDVVQTPPGKLPCRLVLHAVGPKWPDTNRASDTVCCLMQLKRTFDNVFDTARQNDVTSIAIPPIGADVGQVPIVHVADKMYRAVVDYQRRQASFGGSLREVHFVDVRPDVLGCLVCLFENSYQEETATNVSVTRADAQAQAAVDKAMGRSACAEGQPPPGGQRFAGASSAEHRPSLTGQQRGSVAMPTMTPTAGASGVVGYLLRNDHLQVDFRLLLYSAELAAVRTEAIVNPTDGRLRHRRGVSQAIAKAAGSRWKSDCQREIGLSKVPVGGVLVTGPGALPCRYVFHVVPPKWASRAQMAPQELARLQTVTYSCLMNVIQTAEIRSVSTLALPPLSSEKAPADPAEMAEIMFQILTRISNVRFLKEIHIVDAKGDVLSLLKVKLDAAVAGNSLGLQVSPLGGEAERLVQRVLPSGDAPVDHRGSGPKAGDGDLYSEIPAGVGQVQKSNSGVKTIKGKVSGRLSKLWVQKKHTNAESEQRGVPSCPDLPPRPPRPLSLRPPSYAGDDRPR